MKQIKTIRNLTNHLKTSLVDIRTLYFTNKWSTLFSLIVNNSEPDHYPVNNIKIKKKKYIKLVYKSIM